MNKLFRHKTNIFTLVAIAGVFLLFAASLSFAFDIIAVKSSSIKPYNDALVGFKSTCRCTAREVDLAETGEQGIRELIQRTNSDAVLAIGKDALLSVLKTDTVPVFYTMVTWLGSEFEAAPKNLFGLSMDIQPDTYLGTMSRLLPNAKKIGILYNQRNTGHFVKAVLAICRSRGVEVIAMEVSGPGEVSASLKDMRGKIDLFWMLPDTSVVTAETVESILLFSFQNKVPVFSFSSKYVKMGALASLSADPFDLGAQTGEIIANKLAKGLSENPVRVRSPKIVLSVNRKIAEKLGVPLDKEIIRTAAEVY